MGISSLPGEEDLTRDNIHLWPKRKSLLDDGKVVFENKGGLRYLHGAPVGKLILVRVNKDGTRVFKESAEEWFDPDSQAAREFVWPE